MPVLAATVAAVERLALLLRRKSKQVLTDILDEASATMLRRFMTALRKNIGAV